MPPGIIVSGRCGNLVDPAGGHRSRSPRSERRFLNEINPCAAPRFASGRVGLSRLRVSDTPTRECHTMPPRFRCAGRFGQCFAVSSPPRCFGAWDMTRVSRGEPLLLVERFCQSSLRWKGANETTAVRRAWQRHAAGDGRSIRIFRTTDSGLSYITVWQSAFALRGGRRRIEHPAEKGRSE